MKATVRREQILHLIRMQNRVDVSELAGLFGVCMETIRRDLEILEKNHEVKKIHGGAMKPKTYTMEEYLFEARVGERAGEKDEIAKVAASYIKNGDVVALESGTTVLAVVPYLKDKDITIVTNSIPVMNLIVSQKLMNLSGKIIFLGGEFNRRSVSVYGELSIQMLEKIHISKSFLSSQGFTVDEGLTNYNMRESIFARTLINRSEKSFLLLDSSKVNKDSFYTIASADKVDVIISTAPAPQRFWSKVPNTAWVQVPTSKATVKPQ
ncbi:MAG: DeoR family transcriptional regulator [Clostridia bacterium]|nr:DeoR family transcriptional regulator [Clostridia bacterium]